MKQIGRIHNARVFKTLHGTMRIFTRRNRLLNPDDTSIGIVIYNNSWDEGMFINRLFQLWLCKCKGYHVEYWGFHQTRTLVKKLRK
ncbi:conserved hypothetical protein [Vibrio phage 277E43-1]|nr:conserved hypothetical protein [Vibrio phage 277E43-1]